MTVALVVDGGASLPAAGLPAPCALVPMALEHGGNGTSAPSPGAFLEAIEAADQGEGVVVLTVAARLSASHDAAWAAARLAGERHRVEVLDSGTATTGEGLVALAAARAAASGAPLAAVVGSARRAASRIRLAAQISGLDHLARGGRLPPGVLGASRLTGMRPLFELRGGEVRPLRPAFSTAAADARLVALWRRSRPPAGRLHVAGLYASDPNAAERLLAAVSAEVSPETRFAAPLSPVMLAHTGPGVSGLSWWWEEA